MLSRCSEPRTKARRMIEDIQDSHAKGKPEVLLPEDANAVGVPSVLLEVVRVAENDEHPSGKETKPTAGRKRANID